MAASRRCSITPPGTTQQLREAKTRHRSFHDEEPDDLTNVNKRYTHCLQEIAPSSRQSRQSEERPTAQRSKDLDLKTEHGRFSKVSESRQTGEAKETCKGLASGPSSFGEPLAFDTSAGTPSIAPNPPEQEAVGAAQSGRVACHKVLTEAVLERHRAPEGCRHTEMKQARGEETVYLGFERIQRCLVFTQQCMQDFLLLRELQKVRLLHRRGISQGLHQSLDEAQGLAQLSSHRLHNDAQLCEFVA
eukprot:CAMPEP_0194533466 /NCGR_PEP_ID=MMETSP0253-20130528/71350_1 /TAXON_ID=2966 /ORGANISM="Noctiluca scintillans" /LENGTH=245 /DNA_ID=CAMNT_0039379017 /DNA_START=150 /DNA_END=889 /DNA_ORIENTATION=+